MKLRIYTVGGHAFTQEASSKEIDTVKQAFRNFSSGHGNSGTLEMAVGDVTHIIRWEHVVCIQES